MAALVTKVVLITCVHSSLVFLWLKEVVPPVFGCAFRQTPLKYTFENLALLLVCVSDHYLRETLLVDNERFSLLFVMEFVNFIGPHSYTSKHIWCPTHLFEGQVKVQI